MNSEFILPEASRMNITFGGTVVVDALEIGEFAMSVCAAAKCGAARNVASTAPARSRCASLRCEPRSMVGVFITLSCKRARAPSFGISIHHRLHVTHRVLRTFDPGGDAVVDLRGSGERLRAGLFRAALAGVGQGHALLVGRCAGAGDCAGNGAHAMD